MQIYAQYLGGTLNTTINATSGDQIYIHGKATVLDDSFVGSPLLVLRVEGDIVDVAYQVNQAVGSSASLNVNFVYDVLETGEIDVLLDTSEDYSIEESQIDYIYIPASSSASMDLYFGVIIFLFITFFLTWLFRTKRNS